MDKIKSIIEETWINPADLISKNEKYIDQTIDLLESGKIRVANKNHNKWEVNEWIKKGILLYFKKEKNDEMKINFNKSNHEFVFLGKLIKNVGRSQQIQS